MWITSKQLKYTETNNMRKIIKNWKLNRFKNWTREKQADFASQHPNDYRSNWFKKEVKNDISNLTSSQQKELIKNTDNQYLKGFYARAITLERETKRQLEAARLKREQQKEAAYAEAERKSVERKECEEKINAFGGIKCKQVGKIPFLYDELKMSILLKGEERTIDQFEWLKATSKQPIDPDLLREIIRLRPENSPYDRVRLSGPGGMRISYTPGFEKLLIINNCCFVGDDHKRGIKAKLTPYTGKVVVNRGKLAFERQYVEGVLISEANALT